MKLITYSYNGRASYGAVTGGGIVDLGARFGEGCPTLRNAIAQDRLGEAQKAAKSGTADVELADVRYLPVIPNPDKILCVGLNYASHQEETGRGGTDHPIIFVRFANSQMGHDEPMLRPHESTRLDYEGEIAIVIGKGGRRIAEADAMSHIAGYACYNDGSVRDFQRHTTQFTPGKNFAATGGFGPWLVTADEIADPHDLHIQTRLNGEVVQDANSKDLIFSFAPLIAYCSTFTELVPGDVIVTGTPGGVGAARTPPLFMTAGDVVEVEVSGIGLLRNRVEDD